MIQQKINKRIVLAGGPSTGKTSVLNELVKLKYHCFHEAAREIFSDYKQKGQILNQILIKLVRRFIKEGIMTITKQII